MADERSQLIEIRISDDGSFVRWAALRRTWRFNQCVRFWRVEPKRWYRKNVDSPASSFPRNVGIDSDLRYNARHVEAESSHDDAHDVNERKWTWSPSSALRTLSTGDDDYYYHLEIARDIRTNVRDKRRWATD